MHSRIFDLFGFTLILFALISFSHNSLAQVAFDDGAENAKIGDPPDSNTNRWGNCSGNCLVVSDDVSRAGKKSYKAYLNRFTGKPSYRTEGVVRPVADLDRGAEVWYGLSIYIPKSHIWATVGGESLMQFHNNKDHDLGEDKTGSPPTLLALQNGIWKLSNKYSLDPITTKNNKTSNGSWTFPAEKGKWVDWVFHIKWSIGKDGFFQAWKDGKLVVNFKSPNCYNDAKAPKFKVGIYKRAWENKNDTSGKSFDPSVKEVTFYYDEIRAALGPKATYEDVAPMGKKPSPDELSPRPQIPSNLKVD